MKNLWMMGLVLLTAQVTFAQGRTDICRTWYESEVYTGYLYVGLSEPQVPNTPKILWIDTHIPYGIRPMPYEIADMNCENNSIKIFATASNIDVLFSFKPQEGGPEYQPGFFSYINKSGQVYPAHPLECLPAVMKEICARK